MSARTGSPTPTVTAEPSPSAGPGTRRRHVGAWVLVVAVALVLAVLTALVQSTTPPGRDPLDPRSATASGSMALVRVLEQRGTRVDVVRDADRIGDGTVFVDDAAGVLDPDVARRLVRRAEHVVLVSSDPRVLDAVGLPLEPAARIADGDTVATARCGIPAAAAAGTVSTDGTAYVRTPGTPGSDAPDDGTTGSLELCAPTGSGDDRAWGLARTDTPAGDVTLVGTTAAFRNDTVTTAGNAALALGLLGQGGGTDGAAALTWYVPTAGSSDAAPTLGSLAPPWVPGLLGILGLVVVAAAVQRGRRLGPLVVERMPVVVRAAETTEGRARLYARTRDRTHALDTLRVAALRRTARRLGLPRSAHVDEVVRAAARATGRPAHDVGRVLVGGPVGDDRRLVEAVAALDALEAAVRTATEGRSPGPVGTRPPAVTDTGPHTDAGTRAGPSATDSTTGRDTAHDDHRRGARP